MQTTRSPTSNTHHLLIVLSALALATGNLCRHSSQQHTISSRTASSILEVWYSKRLQRIVDMQSTHSKPAQSPHVEQLHDAQYPSAPYRTCLRLRQQKCSGSWFQRPYSHL